MILENRVLNFVLDSAFWWRFKLFLPRTWKLARLSEATARFQQYITVRGRKSKSSTFRRQVGDAHAHELTCLRIIR